MTAGLGAVTAEDVATFERCIAVGGVALFPVRHRLRAGHRARVEGGRRRLYALKGRPRRHARRGHVLRARAGAGRAAGAGAAHPRRRARLLPGPLTLLLPNPARRYPLACGPEPEPARAARAGSQRRPGAAGLAPLAGAPVERQPLRRAPTPAGWRTCPRTSAPGVDLQLDGGELPGTPSTVVDLTGYETRARHRRARGRGKARRCRRRSEDFRPTTTTSDLVLVAAVVLEALLMHVRCEWVTSPCECSCSCSV